MTPTQQTTLLILTLILATGLIYILVQALISERLMRRGKPVIKEEKEDPWPELFITSRA